MAKEGQYLNLKPNVTNWAIYPISGPYTREYRIGELGPAQFGGLSYKVEEDKGNHVYVIQTESFGRVAIWAGDSDSTFTQTPVYTNNSSAAAGGTGRYLNLSPSVPDWSIYNVEGPYTRPDRLGAVAPTQYGGLSYEIEEDLGNHIYVIRTETFGRVAIWAGDQDSTFTHSPTYTDNSSAPGGGTGRYLNLSPSIPTWSVYNPNGPYIREDRIGAVGPAQFGGLSYEIQGVKGNDVYLIQTESFGLVGIWAGDSDSTFTSTPLYLDSINDGKGEGSASGIGEY